MSKGNLQEENRTLSASKANNRTYAMRYIVDALGRSTYQDRFDETRLVTQGERQIFEKNFHSSLEKFRKEITSNIGQKSKFTFKGLDYGCGDGRGLELWMDAAKKLKKLENDLKSKYPGKNIEIDVSLEMYDISTEGLQSLKKKLMHPKINKADIDKFLAGVRGAKIVSEEEKNDEIFRRIVYDLVQNVILDKEFEGGDGFVCGQESYRILKEKMQEDGLLSGNNPLEKRENILKELINIILDPHNKEIFKFDIDRGFLSDYIEADISPNTDLNEKDITFDSSSDHSAAESSDESLSSRGLGALIQGGLFTGRKIFNDAVQSGLITNRSFIDFINEEEPYQAEESRLNKMRLLQLFVDIEVVQENITKINDEASDVINIRRGIIRGDLKERNGVVDVGFKYETEVTLFRSYTTRGNQKYCDLSIIPICGSAFNNADKIEKITDEESYDRITKSSEVNDVIDALKDEVQTNNLTFVLFGSTCHIPPELQDAVLKGLVSHTQQFGATLAGTNNDYGGNLEDMYQTRPYLAKHGFIEYAADDAPDTLNVYRVFSYDQLLGLMKGISSDLCEDHLVSPKTLSTKCSYATTMHPRHISQSGPYGRRSFEESITRKVSNVAIEMTEFIAENSSCLGNRMSESIRRTLLDRGFVEASYIGVIMDGAQQLIMMKSKNASPDTSIVTNPLLTESILQKVGGNKTAGGLGHL